MKNHFENKKLAEEQKSEWTIGKILLRIFLYPFCGLVIFFSLYFFFPDKNYKLGIAGIIITGMYLVSDILIIVKSAIKKRKYSKER